MKPCVLFAGEQFDTDSDFGRLRNMFLGILSFLNMFVISFTTILFTVDCFIFKKIQKVYLI